MAGFLGAVLVNNSTGFTESNAKAPYVEFTLESHYFWREGLVQMPVAEPPAGDKASGLAARTSCEIVRECAPYGWKEVRFSAVRLGAVPEVPHPLSYRASENEVFDRQDVVVTAPPRGMTEQRWSIRGVYVYLLIRPIWAEDGLRAGKVPYSTEGESSNVVPGAAFNRDLH